MRRRLLQPVSRPEADIQPEGQVEAVKRALAASLWLLWVGPAVADASMSHREYVAYKHCEQGIVRSCIHRAVIHRHLDYGTALYIANRESGFHPELCNGEVPGGPHVANRLERACGLFQFMPRTWAGTPYAHRSRFSAKWASLAYAWMVSHGYASAWAT